MRERAVFRVRLYSGTEVNERSLIRHIPYEPDGSSQSYWMNVAEVAWMNYLSDLE
jgi:hypothetical protein